MSDINYCHECGARLGDEDLQCTLDPTHCGLLTLDEMIEYLYGQANIRHYFAAKAARQKLADR